MNKHISYKLFSMVSLLVIGLSIRIAHPALVPFSTINIVALPGVSSNVTYSLTRVYQEPKDTSPVIDVISPGTRFNILGYSYGGNFIAIASQGQSAVRGWIPTSQASITYIHGLSNSLSMGYTSPGLTSNIATVLTPGQKLNILGSTQDGSWLAIADPTSIRTPLYWVARQDLSLPVVTARTMSLTKFYIKPTISSSITNVLEPTYQLLLISRTSDNRWYAAGDLLSGKFIGWVMSNDLTGGTFRDLLPVSISR